MACKRNGLWKSNIIFMSLQWIRTPIQGSEHIYVQTYTIVYTKQCLVSTHSKYSLLEWSNNIQYAHPFSLWCFDVRRILCNEKMKFMDAK